MGKYRSKEIQAAIRQETRKSGAPIDDEKVAEERRIERQNEEWLETLSWEEYEKRLIAMKMPDEERNAYRLVWMEYQEKKMALMRLRNP